MSNVKMNWQWQGTVYSNVAPKSNPNPHTGRVITGMLTGGEINHQTPTRSTGGSSGNNGFGY